MAEKTISQIYGDYGLTNDSTSDPFAKSEQAIMDQTRTFLDERASIRQEQDAAKGFGRSSFSDAAAFKEEEGILANIYSQFAQQRTAEDLKKTQFDRDIVSAGAASDIQKEQIKAQSDAQIAAIQEQGNVEYGVGTTGTQAKKEIIQEQAKFEYGTDEFGAIQTKFDTQIATLQEQQRLGELSQTQLYEQQMGYTDDNGEYHEGLINQEYSEKRDLIEAEYTQGRISANEKFTNDKALYADQAAAQIAAIKEQSSAEMMKLFGPDGTNSAQFDANGEYIPGTGGQIAETYYYTSQLEAAKITTEAKINEDVAYNQWVFNMAADFAAQGKWLEMGLTDPIAKWIKDNVSNYSS